MFNEQQPTLFSEFFRKGFQQKGFRNLANPCKVTGHLLFHSKCAGYLVSPATLYLQRLLKCESFFYLEGHGHLRHLIIPVKFVCAEKSSRDCRLWRQFYLFQSCLGLELFLSSRSESALLQSLSPSSNFYAFMEFSWNFHIPSMYC